MKINFTKIRSKQKELEQYPDFLPSLIFLMVIKGSYNKYLDFLEKEGLLVGDLYWKLAKSRKLSYQEQIDEFKEWVNEHPEFKDFIIEK